MAETLYSLSDRIPINTAHTLKLLTQTAQECAGAQTV